MIQADKFVIEIIIDKNQNNTDGTFDFAPITWVSVTHKEGIRDFN